MVHINSPRHTYTQKHMLKKKENLFFLLLLDPVRGRSGEKEKFPESMSVFNTKSDKM